MSFKSIEIRSFLFSLGSLVFSFINIIWSMMMDCFSYITTRIGLLFSNIMNIWISSFSLLNKIIIWIVRQISLVLINIIISNKHNALFAVINIIEVLSIRNILNKTSEGEVLSFNLLIGGDQNYIENHLVLLNQFNGHEFKGIEIGEFAVQIIAVLNKSVWKTNRL